MAPSRRSLQVNVLLLIALACSAIGTCKAAILGAANRKLLQGSSSGSSTPFGDPPPGTLVITWSAVPAKHAPDFGSVDSPHPPPYQYDWFNLYSPGSENVSLLFYAEDVYVAGPGGQRTQLTPSGGCDVVTTEYPDYMSLINSCRGNFTVPANCPAVSEVYMLLQAPSGLEFQVPTPFDGFNCSALLSENDYSVPGGNYADGYGSFEAVFDSGEIIPLAGDALGSSPASFAILSVDSQPFNGPGPLIFQSINMRVGFDPPVQLPEGSLLMHVIPYAFCYFASNQVTVQSVSHAPPPSYPVSGTCDAYSTRPNQCFNARGDSYVCCSGQCGASSDQFPACKQNDPVPGTFPVGGTCDSNSDIPNQCFNADGSYYVCCPGQCPDNPSEIPRCG